ncbi:MAG: hypothetical protein SF123_23530 [Chloroflexota bacterium]|nr:hypothetical protein [Chloroflexota bacterium]
MSSLLTSHENTREAVHANRQGRLTVRQVAMLTQPEQPQTRVRVRRWRCFALLIGLSLLAWSAAYQVSQTQPEWTPVVVATGILLLLIALTIIVGFIGAVLWSIFNVPQTPEDLRAELLRLQEEERLPIERVSSTLKFRHLTLSRRRKLYSVVLAEREFPVAQALYEKLRLYAVQGEFTAFYLRRPLTLLSIAPSRVLQPDGTVDDATLLREEVTPPLSRV